MFNTARTIAALAKYRGYQWIVDYHRQQRAWGKIREVHGDPKHVIFVFVDHFEPSRNAGAAGVEAVEDWCCAYERIASRICDSDGIHPQHTWFYRFDYPNPDCVVPLTKLAIRRFGEVEFHLHHGNDSEDSFRKMIDEGVKWFGQFGAMTGGQNVDAGRFAYIAGNWALDNGQGEASKSGVSNEIKILANAGCYADFTFPAFGEKSQPKIVNSIYYATANSRPKSYNTGVPVEAGKPQCGDLMIFEGPLFIDFAKGTIEYGAFETYAPYVSGRCEYWINSGIHVLGRPEWLFVKIHTHGMQSSSAVLGDQFEDMCTELSSYCHRIGAELHYATAREAYNIVKAAEAGRSGNPAGYRDYLIPPPTHRLMHCNVSHEAHYDDANNILLEIGPTDSFELSLQDGSKLKTRTARQISRASVRWNPESGGAMHLFGQGEIDVTTRHPRQENQFQFSSMTLPVSIKFRRSFDGFDVIHSDQSP